MGVYAGSLECVGADVSLRVVKWDCGALSEGLWSTPTFPLTQSTMLKRIWAELELRTDASHGHRRTASTRRRMRVATLAFALAVVFQPRAAAAAPTTIPADDARVLHIGRVRAPGDGSLRFTWVGSGVRVAHTGTYLRGTFALTGGVGGSGHAKVRQRTTGQPRAGRCDPGSRSARALVIVCCQRTCTRAAHVSAYRYVGIPHATWSAHVVRYAAQPRLLTPVPSLPFSLHRSHRTSTTRAAGTTRPPAGSSPRRQTRRRSTCCSP